MGRYVEAGWVEYAGGAINGLNGCFRLWPICGALSLATLPISSASAQVADGTEQSLALDTIAVEGTKTDNPYGPDKGYLATRTVSGTKTDTALRDIPQSIQIVPRDVLVDQQDTRLTDALFNVSNVQPAGTIQGRSQTFNIRGFNTQTYAIDGIMMNPAANFSPVTLDMANVSRVEVLKGPSSVMYGRGEPGGIINLVTLRPTATPSAEATFQGGSFDFKRFQGTVSGAMFGTDQLTGRLTFAAQDEATFRHLAGQKNQRYYVAPSFDWNPSPDTRVYVLSQFTKQNSAYDEGLPAVNGRVPTFLRSNYYGEPWSRYHGQGNSFMVRAEHDINNQLMFRQVVNAQWGDFNVYATRATGLNADDTLVNRRLSAVLSNMRSIDTQTELIAKFDTLGLKHTALLGFEYINGYRHAYSQQSSGNTMASISLYNPTYGAAAPKLNFQSDLQQTMRMYGTYVQDQVELAPGLQLLAGVRFDAVRQFYWSRTTSNSVKPADQNLLGVSPRIGLVYRPIEPLSLYASYTKSFNPQTANVLGQSAPPPEHGTQYEVGAKADLIPDRLSATFAAFIIQKTNVAATDPNNSQYSVITGAQESRGVELDIAGEILSGWNVIASFGALDAKITSDTTYQVGNRLTGVPDINGSFWSTYRIQEGAWKGIGFGAGVVFVGRRYGDLNNSFVVGQYARLDAMLSYDINEHYRLAVNGRNLTNAYYVEQPFNQFNNMPGAPLTVVGSLIARF